MHISDVTPCVCRHFPYGCRTVVGTFVALSRWAVVHAQCVRVPNVPTGGVPSWTVSLVRRLLPGVFIAAVAPLAFLAPRAFDVVLGVATRRARATPPETTSAAQCSARATLDAARRNAGRFCEGVARSTLAANCGSFVSSTLAPSASRRRIGCPARASRNASRSHPRRFGVSKSN